MSATQHSSVALKNTLMWYFGINRQPGHGSRPSLRFCLRQRFEELLEVGSIAQCVELGVQQFRSRDASLLGGFQVFFPDVMADFSAKRSLAITRLAVATRATSRGGGVVLLAIPVASAASRQRCIPEASTQPPA